MKNTLINLPRAYFSRVREQIGERNRRVALAALAGVTQRTVAIAGTFMMFPRVLHVLGIDRFGVWGAATSLLTLVVIADFGVGSAILTLVARAFASDEDAQPREYFTAALIMACVISLLVGSFGALVVISLAPKAEVPVYLIAVAGVAMNVPLGSAQSAWLALQRGWMVAFWDFLQTLFLIVGLFVAIGHTTDLRVYVAVLYGALVLSSFLNMGCLLYTHPELRPTTWTAPFEKLRIVMKAGSRYFVLSVFDALSYVLDNIIALQLLGAAASARMVIAQRICIAAIGLLMVVAQPLWPAFVDAAARGDRHWIYRALARGTFVVTTAAVAGSSIIVLFGPRLLKLWLKTDIGIDQRLVWVMAIWIISLSLVRVQVLLLNALQIVQFQVAVFAVATIVSLVLKFVLAPIFGISGIMMATAGTFPIIVLPAILWRVGHWKRSSTV